MPNSALSSESSESKAELWDAPVRIFHWMLALCILFSWITADAGWMTVHLVLGVTALILISFRIVWGIIGSSTARFRSFLTRPGRAVRYLSKSLGDDHQYHGGHNPAGGYMVIAMLAVLFLQAASGLISNNDLGFAGPLADVISKNASDEATILHAAIFNVLVMFVWLHMVAVFYYVLVKQDDLLSPMIKGAKSTSQLPENYKFTRAPYIHATVTLLVVAVATVLLLFR